MEKAAEELCEVYSQRACEARHFLKKKPVDKEEAWGYLDRYLTDRIHHALDYNQSWINIGIAEHENGLPESSRGIMADVVVKTSEAVLAELIEAVSVRPNPYMAMLMARSISATIMTMMEKPVLLNKLAEYMDIDIGDKTQLEMAMHDYFMRSIEANVSRHPWQK